LGHGLCPEFCHRWWQFCSRLLQNWRSAVFTSKANHVANIPLRKALLLRQFVFQIHRQAGNDTSAPAFCLLPGGNQPTDVPIEEDHFRIGRESRAVLGLSDAGLDIAEQVAVEGESRPVHHCLLCCLFPPEKSNLPGALRREAWEVLLGGGFMIKGAVASRKFS